jgi:hypothetical protein
MRGALFIGLAVVILIVGILVAKNMGVDNPSDVTKTQAKHYTERAESAADKAAVRIKDMSEKMPGTE